MPGYPLELLFRPLFKGPPFTTATSGPSQFAGRTTLSSGDATQVVSTMVVKSDSIILHTVEANTRQDSGVAAPIEVMSIAEGSHFSFGTAGGEALARDTTIMWQLFNTS